MAEPEPIEQRVKKIIVNQLGVKDEQVTPQASFLEDLGADSLDTVELIMAFEEEFKDEIKGEIPETDAEKLRTVGQVVEYIEGQGLRQVTLRTAIPASSRAARRDSSVGRLFFGRAPPPLPAAWNHLCPHRSASSSLAWASSRSRPRRGDLLGELGGRPERHRARDAV